MLLDRLGSIDGDLIIGLIALLDTEVVILKIDIEVRQDQLIFDELPDDSSHLIAIEFDDGSSYLNLCHS